MSTRIRRLVRSHGGDSRCARIADDAGRFGHSTGTRETSQGGAGAGQSEGHRRSPCGRSGSPLCDRGRARVLLLRLGSGAELSIKRHERDAADLAARCVPGDGAPDGHPVAIAGAGAALDPTPDRVAAGEVDEHQSSGAADKCARSADARRARRSPSRRRRPSRPAGCARESCGSPPRAP